MDESVVKHLEQEQQQQRITKLSEAIRIGARMRPQAQQVYCSGFGTCALGAAWEATGRDPRKLMSAGKIMWSRPGENMYGPDYVMQELGFGVGSDVAHTVVTMNDKGQSREEIADWLESKGL